MTILLDLFIISVFLFKRHEKVISFTFLFFRHTLSTFSQIWPSYQMGATFFFNQFFMWTVRSGPSLYFDHLKPHWYIRPNPEDRINRKPEDWKYHRRTELIQNRRTEFKVIFRFWHAPEKTKPEQPNPRRGWTHGTGRGRLWFCSALDAGSHTLKN